MSGSSSGGGGQCAVVVSGNDPGGWALHHRSVKAARRLIFSVQGIEKLLEAYVEDLFLPAGVGSQQDASKRLAVTTLSFGSFRPAFDGRELRASRLSGPRPLDNFATYIVGNTERSDFRRTGSSDARPGTNSGLRIKFNPHTCYADFRALLNMLDVPFPPPSSRSIAPGRYRVLPCGSEPLSPPPNPNTARACECPNLSLHLRLRRFHRLPPLRLQRPWPALVSIIGGHVHVVLPSPMN